MITNSDRNVAFNGHTTKQVKNQVQLAAKQAHKSMSQWMHEAFEEKLQRDGVPKGDDK